MLVFDERDTESLRAESKRLALLNFCYRIPAGHFVFLECYQGGIRSLWEFKIAVIYCWVSFGIISYSYAHPFVQLVLYRLQHLLILHRKTFTYALIK